MDANDAASYVEDLAGDNANIIFGAKYDETMTDAATITVIATGLEENAAKITASSNLMSGLKYPNTAATTRPVINSGLVNRTANVTTNSSFGATSTLGQTAAQQPAPTASPFIGITKPKRPESTVHEKDIKIPEFLKSTKK
jgi:cell division protein FtsZ